MPKKNRKARRVRGERTARGARPRRKGWLSTPSLIFIGLILLMAAAMAAVALMGDDVDCPPGQVWSDAHAHCH